MRGGGAWRLVVVALAGVSCIGRVAGPAARGGPDNNFSYLGVAIDGSLPLQADRYAEARLGLRLDDGRRWRLRLVLLEPWANQGRAVRADRGKGQAPAAAVAPLAPFGPITLEWRHQGVTATVGQFDARLGTGMLLQAPTRCGLGSRCGRLLGGRIDLAWRSAGDRSSALSLAPSRMSWWLAWPWSAPAAGPALVVGNEAVWQVWPAFALRAGYLLLPLQPNGMPMLQGELGAALRRPRLRFSLDLAQLGGQVSGLSVSLFWGARRGPWLRGRVMHLPASAEAARVRGSKAYRLGRAPGTRLAWASGWGSLVGGVAARRRLKGIWFIRSHLELTLSRPLGLRLSGSLHLGQRAISTQSAALYLQRLEVGLAWRPSPRLRMRLGLASWRVPLGRAAPTVVIARMSSWAVPGPTLELNMWPLPSLGSGLWLRPGPTWRGAAHVQLRHGGWWLRLQLRGQHIDRRTRPGAGSATRPFWPDDGGFASAAPADASLAPVEIPPMNHSTGTGRRVSSPHAPGLSLRLMVTLGWGDV